MKFIINGRKVLVDIRFVHGIRLYPRKGITPENGFECTIHGFIGTKHDLRKHLKSSHPELFSGKQEVEA
jgi:hypothetical protein